MERGAQTMESLAATEYWAGEFQSNTGRARERLVKETQDR